MTPTAEKPLAVDRFLIESFMRLRALDIEAHGRHVKISGPNGSGKSSTLDALWAALGGKPGTSMPEPIHNGADRAKVTLHLQDSDGKPAYKIERVWTEKGSRVEVRAADGSKVSRPQDLLDSFSDDVALNPIEWLRKRPQDQVDDVLRVCGVNPPVDQVTAITGESHPPQKDESAAHYLERLSADETGLYYVRRREANRVVQVKDAALVEFQGTVTALADEIEPDLSALMAERSALNQRSAERHAVLMNQASVKRSREEAVTKLAGLKAELPKVEARIADLRRMLAEEEAKSAELSGRILKGVKVCSEWDAEVFAADQAASLLADPTPRIADVERRIADADRSRQEIAKRRQARETVLRLQDEAIEAKEAHGRLDMIVESLRELRKNLLNDVDLGIRGLAIGDGELRLDGVSFKQASQAQKISVACAIAFKRNPRLKILRLDDAEHLDRESETLLRQLADAHGWQCFMSFVRDEDDLRIVFEE